MPKCDISLIASTVSHFLCLCSGLLVLHRIEEPIFDKFRRKRAVLPIGHTLVGNSEELFCGADEL